MQAVILAGGLGERLRPLTEKTPKPMVTVSGRPYLEYQIDWMRSQNISGILILTGYLGEKIEEHFKDGSSFGVKITYSRELRPMGTAGALKLAEEKLESYFALINGDSFLPVDFSALERLFLKYGTSGILAVYDNRSGDTGVLNNVQLDDNGLVLKYQKNSGNPDLNFVDAGVMILKKEILDLIPQGRNVSLEEDILPLLIGKGEFCAYISKAPFYDIGTQGRLKRFEEAIRIKNFNFSK